MSWRRRPRPISVISLGCRVRPYVSGDQQTRSIIHTRSPINLDYYFFGIEICVLPFLVIIRFVSARVALLIYPR